MSVRIVICGESQCLQLIQVSQMADHLAKSLPNFKYELITIPVLEWKVWLMKLNAKNNWHHLKSPLVWKEVLLSGSKPFYIGGASEFFEYCHSYYNLDAFMSEKVFGDLENGIQYEKKLKAVKEKLIKCAHEEEIELDRDTYKICISGASHESTNLLISAILDLSEQSSQKVSSIFLFDTIEQNKLKSIEREFTYVDSFFPGRVVKVSSHLGTALVLCDLLIVMDHVPYSEDLKIEDWLDQNFQKMIDLSYYINASASLLKTRILFPNFGPSCFNATVLSKAIRINNNNIVVSTGDLGLQILKPVSEIAEIPMNTIFCPPVWGFVGVNHLVDVRTTYHKYYSLYPYDRMLKVEKTTLKYGELTPELRTLEYLMFWDKSLWIKVAERKTKGKGDQSVSEPSMHKIKAAVGTIKLWLFDASSSDSVTCLGLPCNGSFGLTLDGIFSQPAHLVDGQWKPAENCYPKAKDPYIKIKYFEETAKRILEETFRKRPIRHPEPKDDFVWSRSYKPYPIPSETSYKFGLPAEKSQSSNRISLDLEPLSLEQSKTSLNLHQSQTVTFEANIPMSPSLKSQISKASNESIPSKRYPSRASPAASTSMLKKTLSSKSSTNIVASKTSILKKNTMSSKSSTEISASSSKLSKPPSELVKES